MIANITILYVTGSVTLVVLQWNGAQSMRTAERERRHIGLFVYKQYINRYIC